MTIKYVAEDGKEFSTAEGCKSYEIAVLREKHPYFLYDKDGTEVECFKDCKYVICPTRESAQLLAQEYGSKYIIPFDALPVERGIWQWVYDEENSLIWIKINETAFQLYNKYFN